MHVGTVKRMIVLRLYLRHVTVDRHPLFLLPSAVAHKVVAALDRKILLCQVGCTAQAHDFVYKPFPLEFFISMTNSVASPCINTFLYLVDV